MKSWPRVIYLILSMIVMGCVQSDLNDTSSPVALSGSLINSTTTEPENSLPLGSELGLFALNPSGSGFYAQNIKYVADGARLVAADKAIDYQPGSPSVTLYAYSPHNPSGMEYNSLNFDLTTDQNTAGTTSSNLLWGTTTATKGSGRSPLKMRRLMSLIKINLSSKSGNDISGAKVELLDQYYSTRVDIKKGEVSLRAWGTTSVRARQLDVGSYEAVILPIGPNKAQEFIRVSLRSTSYTYTIQPRSFEKGKEYTFDIVIKDDVVPELECAIALTYNGSPLGATLTVPAVVTDRPLTLIATPEKWNRFKSRNESGEYAWARISNPLVSTDKNAMGHKEQHCNLQFDENFGPQRTMTLEFYDVENPRAVYKKIVVTQLAATDYMTLSSNSVSVDKFGNVYDIPYELDVKSNKEWSIESSASWIHPSYQSSQRNQIVKIVVDINNTGAARSGTLQFMVGGRAYKSIPITQSATEASSFTLRYELNFDLATYGNWFNHQNWYYPDEVDVFNYYPSEFGDAVARINSDNRYGFLIDAPDSYNKIEVRGLRHGKFFTCRNYSGRATTINALNITVGNKTVKHSFFRSFKVDLPIPAGVKRNQFVIYHMDIVDTQHMLVYPRPAITYKIVEQQP